MPMTETKAEWLPEWDDPNFVYEPRQPSLRNFRDGWWATRFEGFEEAVTYWSFLYTRLGKDPEDSVESAVRWAMQYGYIPEGYRRKPMRGSIKDIKASVRIEDVADRLTKMRWNSTSGRGRCPLHGGNNPQAFVVYNETQRFYCFGCNEGGDVITLMQRGGLME